jgi:hypothetical protein
MKKTVKLPNGSELSLFAARIHYRKTQCRIVFYKLIYLLHGFRALFHYLLIRIKLYFYGFDMPHNLTGCRDGRKIFLNSVKMLFGYSHNQEEDAKSLSASSVEKPPCNPLRTNE